MPWCQPKCAVIRYYLSIVVLNPVYSKCVSSSVICCCMVVCIYVVKWRLHLSYCIHAGCLMSVWLQITSSLQMELNRLYASFSARNPYFEANGGKVSIVAHSLGEKFVVWGELMYVICRCYLFFAAFMFLSRVLVLTVAEVICLPHSVALLFTTEGGSGF